MLDERVVITADSPAHLVLSLGGSIIVSVLYYEVDRRARVQVFAQITEIVQHE